MTPLLVFVLCAPGVNPGAPHWGLSAASRLRPQTPNSPAAGESIEVVASEKGFEPRVINLRKGDPVRLRLTTSDREHCFALDAFRVEKRILPGRATLVDLTPEKAGTFAFQCCIEEGAAADKEHGRLVVVE